MSRLSNLQSASSLRDLAHLLQFKPAKLSYMLYRLSPEAKYRTFEIPKRTGGTRTITAPSEALKVVQQQLSILLQDCLDEINRERKRKDRIAHGFKRQRSIVTNAKQHRHRRYVFNVDLSDFFPSINFGRVRGYLIRNNQFKLHEKLATVIAQIACHENMLPQGSPCSPVISNLIAHILDIHLVRLCARVGCTYSRYADDLTFSTNKKIFPLEIARPSDNEPHRWMPGPDLEQLVARSGFAINPTKTRMQYRTARQVVTGLVVNQRINVRREYRHTVRAMVHHLLKTGTFETYGVTGLDRVLALEKRPGTLNELQGMLGFIHSVDEYNIQTAHPAVPIKELRKKEAIYRSFLIYRYFFAAEKPVVLCEGETDAVYLTHAIRSLASTFPQLATINTAGTIQLKVRLYKYRPSGTSRIIGLYGGGSASLGKFIGTYKKETATFGAPGQEHPVIVVYDSDSGANRIRSAVKEASGRSPEGEYSQVIRNLYVVPTPLPNNAEESKIEDFFDDATKDTVIAGKTFNENNKFEPGTQYGKKVFAHRVVKSKAGSINFDGFRPLLEVLSSVIAAHSAVRAEARTKGVMVPAN